MRYIEDPVRISRIEADLGLPDLIGTPKQVKWARKIRANILFHTKYILDNHYRELQDFYDFVKNIEEASRWIDMKDKQWQQIDAANECFFRQDFPEMHVYRPESPSKEGMVTILHLDGLVWYKYPYDADFNRIMHQLKCSAGFVRHEDPWYLKQRAKTLLLSGFTLNCDREIDVEPAVLIPEDLMDDD